MSRQQKGSQFERDTCQRFSLWVSGARRRDLFWRSATSGGQHSRRKREGRGGMEAHAGDIVCTDPLGGDLLTLFTLECKFYADFDAEQLFFGRETKGKIRTFWSQACHACTGIKQPLLCLRQNFQPEVVLTTHNGYRWLRTGGKLKPVLTIHSYEALVFRMRDVMMLDFQPIRRIARLRAAHLEVE